MDRSDGPGRNVKKIDLTDVVVMFHGEISVNLSLSYRVVIKVCGTERSNGTVNNKLQCGQPYTVSRSKSSLRLILVKKSEQ